MVNALDLQAADGSSPGRDPEQPLGPEADLREGPGVGKPGPTSSRSSTIDPVLTAFVLATSLAVESSIGDQPPASQGKASSNGPTREPRSKPRM